MTQERAPSPGTRVARAALSQVGERESEVNVREVARREPWTQHRGDEVASLKAASLAVEVMAGRVLDIAAGLCDTRNFDERIPLAARQRDDHYAAAVARLEVVAEGAIEIITVLGLVASAELGLCDAAEIPDHRERNIGEREANELAFAGQAAMALGGEHPDGGERAHRDVPRGQDAVERLGEVARAGRPWEAGGRVDGVVDFAGAVGIAGQRHHDEVSASLHQRIVSEPSAGREVRQEDAGVLARRRDERGREFASLRRAEIELNRTLAFVEAVPEEALAVVGEGPSMVIEAAADLVETNHVGTELRERHAAEWRRDESGALDDAKAGKNSRCHAITPTKRQSRTSCGPPSWSARTRERKCTSPPPPGSGSTRSSSRLLRSVSPSRTGPRWSQLCHATIVTRLGNARAACDAASPIVWPP